MSLLDNDKGIGIQCSNQLFQICDLMFFDCRQHNLRILVAVGALTVQKGCATVQFHTDIMGIKIPTTTIPVKPGRNLAVVLEIAAMNNRQKKMGYNTAEEFNQKLLQSMGISDDDL